MANEDGWSQLRAPIRLGLFELKRQLSWERVPQALAQADIARGDTLNTSTRRPKPILSSSLPRSERATQLVHYVRTTKLPHHRTSLQNTEHTWNQKTVPEPSVSIARAAPTYSIPASTHGAGTARPSAQHGRNIQRRPEKDQRQACNYYTSSLFHLPAAHQQSSASGPESHGLPMTCAPPERLSLRV